MADDYIGNRRRRRETMPGQPGCHIRFETAIATELKRCTDQIYAGNVEDRATMAAKLKERKIANTKASVVLGTDEPLWETDMMRSMSNGEITPEFIQCMIEDKQQADSLAAELKIDHCIGVVTGVEPTTNFTQTSTMADPTGEMHKYTSKIGGRTASKASSVYFGSHEPDYHTTMQDCMSVVGMDTAKGLGQGDARAHAKLLKSKLQVSSFQIGYDEPTYVSAMHEGHPPLNVAAAQRILSKEVMDDLRKVHYSLGEDKVVYETDMMRSMRNGEITPEFIQCMKEDKAQADALAAELKIDHCRGVVTGVYPEYC